MSERDAITGAREPNRDALPQTTGRSGKSASRPAPRPALFVALPRADKVGQDNHPVLANGPRVVGDPAAAAQSGRDVSILTQDSVTLRGTYWPPREAGRASVALLHDVGGNRRDWFGFVPILRSPRMGDPGVRLARTRRVDEAGPAP